MQQKSYQLHLIIPILVLLLTIVMSVVAINENNEVLLTLSISIILIQIISLWLLHRNNHQVRHIFKQANGLMDVCTLGQTVDETLRTPIKDDEVRIFTSKFNALMERKSMLLFLWIVVIESVYLLLPDLYH